MTVMYDVSGRAFMVASAMFADHQLQDAVVEDIPISLQQILDDLLNSPDNRINSCKALFEECKIYCDRNSGLQTTTASLALERAASIMTELCVRGTHMPTFERTAPAVTNGWILATAPVRVDLSGGWSDTPPICFEYGGAVAGLAVTVDGMKPLSSRCRIIPGGSGIYICTESRDAITGELQSYASSKLSIVSDLDDCRNPHADCALIKCALVYLGLLSDDAAPSQDLQPFLRRFCGLNHQVGLEIVSTSLLPRGSGMGTSSILAGCVLACLARCVGIDLHENDDLRLVSVVLELEQLLTCGGGWQDQIGGLFGGFKLGTSKAYEFPVIAHVQRTPLKQSTIAKLDDRLILVFSGQTRLAKNILQQVLHRWSRRTPEIVDTVQALVQGAHRASRALVDEDLDTVAQCLNNYWRLKKTMAGDDSGVEPEVVRHVFAELFERNEIVAGSLCGAGGGGFMVLLASEGRTMDDVKSTFDKEILPFHKDAAAFTWHKGQVSEKGLATTILPLTADAFDIAWHMS
ncbi:L-fucokinase [Fragilaria crotonensis]|nr:L-fucokinase [Fragilaria crotonensis]